MTHPFHPWHGRQFLLVGVRQNWSEDRVFFLDDQGVQHSLPVGWTDAAGPDRSSWRRLAGARSGWLTSARWRV